ncbi:MAG: hypothetical protein JWN62_83 [Acidimicrobiales bacterium]|nr:hypothetical protein [Acidimicrobiales bacterium]
MQQDRRQHPNAQLTPAGRLKMVKLVIDEHWSIEATAERFQVDAKTVRKWRDRYVAEGWSARQVVAAASLTEQDDRPETQTGP